MTDFSASKLNSQSQLSESRIDIWICEPEKVTEPLLVQRYQSWLTEQENRKRLRYRFERHQHQYLLTRALIRSTLSRYRPEIQPSDWQFTENQWGKPALVDEQNPESWAFNLSHTDGLIACAITRNQDVGIDVEDVTREGETIKIADRYFSPSEYRALLSLEQTQQQERFFDLWTLKESYIKACGKGLAIALDSFSFRFPMDAPELQEIALYTEAERHDDPAAWRFWNWSWGTRHRISLGIKNPGGKPGNLSIASRKCVPLLSDAPVELATRHTSRS